ncbi:hypothetical protein [Guyparkeria sp.]|uniref:hypothetical protein n=1 Tax=Guyparkeria sp. TaxID=2035736 RepID=UPI003970F87D
MRKPDAVDWRCGILDVLEAAALHGDHAEIRLDGRWRRVRVIDVLSEGGDDWLLTDDGQRIAVGSIEMARPVPA